MLESLGRIMDDATLLVTFNGRTFDVPLMETRWAFHRSSAATDDLPHFDMLPSARRLWGRREVGDVPERASCTLSALERSVLGFHRVGDVPGLEIPVRYFHFLRTGEARAIEGVLEHNRHDLLSLAGVMSHALSLAREGPEACTEPGEQLALGRLYERVGERDRAMKAFELAAAGDDRELRPHAFARLATLLARLDRHDEAATAWRAVLDSTRGRRGASAPLARRATEALAIHHEHRVRDLPAARTYAAQLHADAAGRSQHDAAHRLGRIDRKLATRESKERLDF
jgi:tetratricopeptide (TPR) repeat protein